MIAVHLHPGPNGYAVLVDDIVLADGLTAERALRMVRGGKEGDKRYQGNRRVVHIYGDGRQRRLNFAHNEAQSREDFFVA